MLADKCYRNHRDVGVVMRNIYKGETDHSVWSGWRNLKTPNANFFPWLNETFLSTQKYSMETPTSRLGNFCTLASLRLFHVVLYINRVSSLSSFGKILTSLCCLFPAWGYVDKLVIYLSGTVAREGSQLWSSYGNRVPHEDAVSQISCPPVLSWPT